MSIKKALLGQGPRTVAKRNGDAYYPPLSRKRNAELLRLGAEAIAETSGRGSRAHKAALKRCK